MGRSRGIELAALALVVAVAMVGCSKEKREGTAPAPQMPRTYRTFDLASSGEPDTAIAVRDFVSGDELRIEDRGGLLVLLSKQGVIDTATAPGAGARGFQLLDPSFLRLTTRRGEALAATDLIGIVDGELRWSAHLPESMRFPAPAGPLYSTALSLQRSPLALTGAESYAGMTADSTSRPGWRRPFDLRFDDSSRVFYNVSVALDSVPIDDGTRVATGRRPGIALRMGTTVFIDGRWYALSLPEDLDPEEFARGTSGMVLEGKGEWGDTLRPVASR